jgi:hypothetical protein
MPDPHNKRLLRGVRNALAAMTQCRGSLSDARCHASLHSNLGSLVKVCIEPAPDTAPPTVKQQERLAAALMALLAALAEERHPCDDAWQTATLATFKLLQICAKTQPVLADQFLPPAGARLPACTDAI